MKSIVRHIKHRRVVRRMKRDIRAWILLTNHLGRSGDAGQVMWNAITHGLATMDDLACLADAFREVSMKGVSVNLTTKAITSLGHIRAEEI